VSAIAAAGLSLLVSPSASVPNGEVLAEVGKNGVFVINHGTGNKIIRGFDPKQNHKIRIAGFGITHDAALSALMHQVGPDIEIRLPGGQQLWILKAAREDLPAEVFQLELDRTGLVQTFADEFDTFSWDSEGAKTAPEQQGTWRTNFGFGPPTALDSRTLVSNKELEVYADSAFRGTSDAPLGANPFRVVDGVLEITATPAPDGMHSHIWNRRYISGLITTRHSFSQQYGVFEMRARVPKGRGLWPAFWLLLPNGAWPPEIDILEILGDRTTTLNTSWHSLETGTQTTETIETNVPDLSEGFHTFALEWDKNEIKWFFDGVAVARKSTPADMHQPMYLLANLAVGGGWPGDPDASTRFPAVFAIDWIRVYRRASGS
jgi:beta-glucanase (GH16 family)